MVAGNVFFYLYFFSGAIGNFGKIHFQPYAQVGAAGALPAAATTTAAKHTAKHVVAENIAEVLEYIFHAHTAGTLSAKTIVANTRMAEAVILCAFIGVAQHIICL